MPSSWHLFVLSSVKFVRAKSSFSCPNASALTATVVVLVPAQDFRSRVGTCRFLSTTYVLQRSSFLLSLSGVKWSLLDLFILPWNGIFPSLSWDSCTRVKISFSKCRSMPPGYHVLFFPGAAMAIFDVWTTLFLLMRRFVPSRGLQRN